MISVGVDATEQSGYAAEWAARMAEDLGTSLTVVHALDHIPGASRGSVARRRELAAAQLGRTAGQLANQHPGLHVDTVLDDRSPDRVLTELSLDSEFLVVGTRGYSGIAGLLLRSVSTGLADHGYCPTVIVRGPQPAVTKPEVVLGLQPDEDPAPIDFAFRAAARLGCEVQALRAFQPASSDGGYYVDDVEIGRRDALIGMGSLLRQFRESYPEVPVSCEAHCAETPAALNSAARHARLLVIGGRHWHAARTPRLGHTVSELIAGTGTPIAVVPMRGLS
jgi:nucleotide-binding universal stress UspA family protein